MSSYNAIPSVDKLLSEVRIRALIDKYSRTAILNLIRTQLDHVRADVRLGKRPPNLDALVASIEEEAGDQWQAWPKPVINATGVILHTNLGRAPLSNDATAATIQASSSYNNLELDLQTGKRGSRHAHLSALICQLTGAEAAIVVNNNASAILLALAAITTGKEVIVSRSESVEIGGGFRVPDVLQQSGASLIDVGTTNRTYHTDYENAITDNTGAILSVHSSNFRVDGFIHRPGIEELANLGNARDIPVLHDLGSGCLLSTANYGLAPEPMPQESITAGVSLTFFSGDKLLGGPQAGIVAGNRELVNRIAAHPLARAVRSDKLTLSALNATLLHYIRGEAEGKIPVWQMISATKTELTKRAENWKTNISQAYLSGTSSKKDLIPTTDDQTDRSIPITTKSAQSTVGGGSLPGETLATTLLSIDCRKIHGGAETISSRLRQSNPPIISRIENERVLLDPRTVLPTEDGNVLKSLLNILF